MFITFEGIDGAGKSTQINRLVDKIKSHFPEVEIIVTREPGGTDLGVRLRSEILHSDAIAPETELFLYLADRSEHVFEKIAPALKRGAIVISDRFADSTVAYQKAGRNLDADLINKMNAFATASIIPNLTVFLDLTAEQSRARVKNSAKESGQTPDRIETEKEDFFEKVRAEFLEIARSNPDRSLVIDATKGEDEIAQMIFSNFLERFQK